MITTLLNDVNNFQQSNEQKLKSCNALINLILISEKEITPYSDKILPVLQRFLNNDDGIGEAMQKAAEVLGLYVSCDVTVPLIQQKIQELDSSSQNAYNSYVYIMGQCLKHVTPQQIEKHLNSLVQLIQNVENAAK